MDLIKIDKQISDITSVVLKLSMAYLEKMNEGKLDEASKDDLAHINEMKKHLTFVKKLRKEIASQAGESNKKQQASGVPTDIMKKIKNLQSSLGNIIKSIPQE
jgi:predicted phage-related endonuclease